MALWLFVAAIVGILPTRAVSVVPIFELKDLLEDDSLTKLSSILSTTGLLAVRSGSPLHGERALEGFCRCGQSMPQSERVTLKDGTLRTTLGTTTVGHTAVALPEYVNQYCGEDVREAMEALRDDVATVTNAFVGALDRILSMDRLSRPLLRNSYQGEYQSIASIQAAANHLEHFHIYSKPHEQKQNFAAPRNGIAQEPLTLDWHTDAGLFLAFVPARNCPTRRDDTYDPIDTAFWLPSSDGIIQAEFPTDSVIIMLGAGAQHWLNTGTRTLKATKHAVHLETGQTRAWYGMMTLVPEIAIIQENPQRTFGAMKKQMSWIMSSKSSIQENQAISIGCGLQEPRGDTARSVPRRLQHVIGPSACNNETNFFCWMSCLDIPHADKIDEYLDDSYSLYCLDPAILASSGNQVKAAVEPCQGVDTMNPKCTGQWLPTAADVPGYDLQRSHNSSSAMEKFCYGGTSMYMDGFHWTDTICIIYLFPRWVLSSQGRVVAACFGTLVFGILMEFVLYQRRVTTAKLKPGTRRLMVSALFYGVQLTMGYMLMLVIMTYSGPLFLCTVLGLVGGHVAFNSRDALFGATKNRQESSETANESTVLTDLIIGQAPCQNISDEPEPEPEPKPIEGITPCCQHEI